MYLRACSMAAEPAGRGPMATSSRRSAHARLESNVGAAAVCAARATATSTRAVTRRSSWLLPLLPRDIVARQRSRVDLPRPRDFLLRVEQHLFPLRNPAGGARNGEQHGKHFDGEPHRLVDETGIEIDVRIELARDEILVLQGDPFQLQGDFEQRILAGDGEDEIGDLLDHRGAWIVRLVDPVRS